VLSGGYFEFSAAERQKEIPIILSYYLATPERHEDSAFAYANFPVLPVACLFCYREPAYKEDHLDDSFVVSSPTRGDAH
jgi:hypothetical protein